MKAVLPFKINYSPITKLALINFEKKPEKIYKGLELQYIEGESYGKGYRVIAYRNDSYVDVYDEYSLTYLENEKFDVAENGLNKHVQTEFFNVIFEKRDGKEEICFSFSDLLGREINVSIREHTKKKSTPMNILAPIGLGSKKPNYLPVFFLYDFDFIRKSKTKVNVDIDGKMIILDKFPLPMNMQFRYYSRYSENCQLIEFINSEYNELLEVELNHQLSCTLDYVEYHFNKEAELQGITIDTISGRVKIEFNQGVALNKEIKGEFSILPDVKMGYIKGDYQIIPHADNDTCQLILVPSAGWTPVPNSWIIKMIMGPKSIFRGWSKQYRFEQTISFKYRKVTGRWNNGNLKK